MTALLPRLLTEQAAADYLSIPKACMKKVASGRTTIAGRVRWDRQALDAWLDEQHGVEAKMPDPPADDSPDAALQRFSERFENAPRGA